MFTTVKQQLSLLAVISKDLGVDFQPVGSSNFAIAEEKDFGGCPFCHHMECFRVKVPEGEDELEVNEKQFYKCFSCGKHGDVIKWRVERGGGEELKPAKEAVLELATEFNVKLPVGQNPIQAIFSNAAKYYHAYLMDADTPSYRDLGGLTPLQYQLQVRKHPESILKTMQVGFSDGGLRDFLESVGFDIDLLLDSGLVNKKTGRDYLPARCFIYPQRVKGMVSHFTFKDPSKKLAFQLPSKFSLNDYMFYGQDSVEKGDPVVVVEGENDLLTCVSEGAPAVIATIGQLSSAQLSWMKSRLEGKRVLTAFDGDEAGDKYRKRVEALRPSFRNLAHIRPPEGSDIDDEIRKKGRALGAILKEDIVKVDLTADEKGEKPSLDVAWDEPDRVDTAAKPAVSPPALPEVHAPVLKVDGAAVETSLGGARGLLKDAGLAIPGEEVEASLLELSRDIASIASDADLESAGQTVEMENNPVIQHKGCYWKLRKDKEGTPDFVKLSDFVIQLKNVFIGEDGERTREVVVIRQNGIRSKPFTINSEAKISLKPFRLKMAEVADAEWTGTELDLCGMWNLVYGQDCNTVVNVPRSVGYHPKYSCWIFRNCLITDAGVVVEPDPDGIFWINGKTIGIRPESLSTNASKGILSNADIPRLETSLKREEVDALEGAALLNLSRNLNAANGDLGMALMIMGWTWANLYSDVLFSLNRGFPFLMLWGTNGKGKTTLAKWMQCFYGMEEHGSTSVPQLKSAVGWNRKAAYYSSLPLMVDEVRSNDETRAYLGMFRSWYDREGRTLGTKEEFGVRTQQVNAGFVFCGEDQFEDPATRERAVSLRIPSSGRELDKTYAWFQDNSHLLSGITFFRIFDKCATDVSVITSGVKALDKELLAAGCGARISKNWSAVGFFAMALANKHVPDFDIMGWLKKNCVQEVSQQKEDNTLTQFWEIAEGIMAQDNSRINSAHIRRKGDEVFIWYPPIYREVYDATRGKFTFSKNAVLNALREEGYCKPGLRKVFMGIEGRRQNVIALDLHKAPLSIRNMALANEEEPDEDDAEEDGARSLPLPPATTVNYETP
jgi:5S rRNA maturation endonuclease (ribonuclease M5)